MELSDYLAKSTEASGVPLKVADKPVLRDIAALLIEGNPEFMPRTKAA
jgi:hypothetical protein